jgi:hypothetical protein
MIKMADGDLVSTEFDRRSWNRYLLLGLLSALVPFHVLRDRQFRRIFQILRHDIKLPSISSLTNLLHREYETTLLAIKSQIPKGQKVSLALDGWTSKNNLAITSVIAYYIGRNWSLEEVQLAFEEVRSLKRVLVVEMANA